MAQQSPAQNSIDVSQSGSVKIGGDINEVYKNINVGGDVMGRDTIVNVGKGADIIVRQAATFIAPEAPIDHSLAPLKGVGLWIWKLELCEGGHPQRIAERAAATRLSHVGLKVADGSTAYPSDQSSHPIREVAAALHNRNIQVWGWHYLRGDHPNDEARIAARQISYLNLDGYIVDVESEFKQPGKDKAAEIFFRTLKESGSTIPIALSSYHYPSFHRDLPWQVLLEHVDFVVPQVYWEQAHNPAAQLTRSLDEYSRLQPARPVFPLGSAFGVGEWQPTPTDLMEFFAAARDLSLNGVSFFNWDWIGREENRELWKVLETIGSEMERVPHEDEAEAPIQPEPPSVPQPLQSPVPEPTFERRFIQIIRNDEVEKVEDRLGFERYADAFVQLVLDDRTRPPLTIGISGAWGSGKSFLLHRIYQKLDALPPGPAPRRRWYQFRAPRAQRRVHVVRFNAWDYNVSEAVWPGLVRGILDNLEAGAGAAERAASRARRNLQRQIGGVRNKLLVWSALLVAALIVAAYLARGNFVLLVTSLAGLGFAGVYAIFKSLIDLPMAQWLTDLFSQGRSYGSALGYMEEIRSDIKELKKRLPANTKIVVIIDDLDRCGADKIVDTLEALKLLLNFDIFVVFLAVDSSVIARAIEKRYKDLLAEAGRSGFFYLDKIIQIPFRLPEPDASMVNKYLFGLLSAADAPPTQPLPPEKAKRLNDLFGPFLQRPDSLLPMMEALPNDPVEAETIAREIQNRLAPNGVLPSLASQPGPAPITGAALAWMLLARWWPVSAYLMHEALRARPANADGSPSALKWLADEVQKKSEADIRSKRLREVVDGPLEMFAQAILKAPAFTFQELEDVLVRWKTPYAVTIGFSPAELEAFQNLSGYMLKNPRHIKRMVNTYSLIRMLAARSPSGELVTNAPETMLKWLLLSSQWPMSAQAMLQAFDDEREAMRAGEQLPADDDALTRLYTKAEERFKANSDLQKERARLDNDLDVLNKLVGDSLRTLTSRQLDLLRAYSINFNPAENSLPLSAALPSAKPPAAEAGLTQA